VGGTPRPSKKGEEPPASDIFSDSSGEVEALQEDVPKSPVPKKKTKAKADAEEVEELVPVGAGPDEDEEPRKKVKPAKPKRMRYILVGFFLALLLLVGGLGAIWFLAPDMFYGTLLPAIPQSPNAKHEHKIIEQPKLQSLEQAARELPGVKKERDDLKPLAEAV